ncbi:MAG: ABC transporter substrate-binding protein [Firmicutes bacterium]|nr:ABC transporter substrate-binding protein [Bacillota bacterium]MCL1953334.1 ABC transporter substrate-binding protein [Bacillota bacterium]
MLETNNQFIKKSVVSVIAICLLFVVSFGLIACNIDNQKMQTVTLTDMVGDVVSVPKSPKKVGALSRSAVDMLVAFGLSDTITGVFDTIFDNEWASIIHPSMSKWYKYDYNTTIETYLEHGVDLVIAPEQYLAQNLREHGIPAITVSQYGEPNYDNYIFYFADMIKIIFDDYDVVSKIERWKDGFSKILNQINTSLEEVSITKTLFYTRGDSNRGLNYTEATDKTIQNTICKYLKVDYAGKGFDTSQPTKETLLQLDPDYIIVGGAFQNTIINEAKSDSIWQDLSAFKNDTAFNIGVGFVSFEQNGVWLTAYLADLANKIYPDIFEFDIISIVKNTAKDYFDVELSNEDVSNMLKGLNRNGQPLA